MAEQYQPNVGQLAGDDARRDAIHFAVAPVIAGEDLDPGDHVGLNGNQEAMKDIGVSEIKRIGLVDPFLSTRVLKGQKFWLFLYPNTITNLRHVWSHPAFKPKLPGVTA